LNYNVNFKNKYIAETGCIVEVYNISKNKEKYTEHEEKINNDEIEM